MRTTSNGRVPAAEVSQAEVSQAEAPQQELWAQPMADLVRETIRHYRKRLRTTERAVRTGADPEGVHDMRVAIRGLRAALDVFAEAGVLKPGVVRPISRRLGRVARALGQVRDLDIMAESVLAYVATNADASTSLTRWTEYLEQRHDRAQVRARAELKRPAYRHVVRDLRRLSRREAVERRVLVRHCAGSALWRRYEAVLLACEEAAPTQSPEQLHALRIACKRLRYVADVFADGFGAQAAPIQETLVRGQKVLGSAHDAVTELAALHRYCHKHKDSEWLRPYIEAETQHRDALWAEVAPLQLELGGESLRHALAAVLAAL